jgi:hypothetical protein
MISSESLSNQYLFNPAQLQQQQQHQPTNHHQPHAHGSGAPSPTSQLNIQKHQFMNKTEALSPTQSNGQSAFSVDQLLTATALQQQYLNTHYNNYHLSYQNPAYNSHQSQSFLLHQQTNYPNSLVDTASTLSVPSSSSSIDTNQTNLAISSASSTSSNCSVKQEMISEPVKLIQEAEVNNSVNESRNDCKENDHDGSEYYDSQNEEEDGDSDDLDEDDDDELDQENNDNSIIKQEADETAGNLLLLPKTNGSKKHEKRLHGEKSAQKEKLKNSRKKKMLKTDPNNNVNRHHAGLNGQQSISGGSANFANNPNLYSSSFATAGYSNQIGTLIII